MSDSTKLPVPQLLASVILVIVFIVAAGLLILFQPWRNLTPWSRLDPAKFAKLTVGMTRADVELLLGGPPGDYGNPELRDSPTMSTMEGNRHPKGAIGEVWFDDRNKFELCFDTTGHLAHWHKRARFSRDYRPPEWLRKIREWIRI